MINYPALMPATEITTQALADRLGVTRERIGHLREAGKLSHEPRKIQQGKKHYIYLWPADTKRLKSGKTGRPKKVVDK